jgi:hypothetical protein
MDDAGIASVGAAGVDAAGVNAATALDPSTVVDASFVSLSLFIVVSLFSFISLSFVVLAAVFDVTTGSNCVRSLGGLIENVGAVVEISILPLPPPLSMSKWLLSLDIVVTFVVGVVILIY